MLVIRLPTLEVSSKGSLPYEWSDSRSIIQVRIKLSIQMQVHVHSMSYSNNLFHVITMMALIMETDAILVFQMEIFKMR